MRRSARQSIRSPIPYLNPPLKITKMTVYVLGCCNVRKALSSLVELSTDRDMGEVARKAIARMGR